MDDIEKALAEWKGSLLNEIEARAVYARSSVAHKWKAPFRSLVLRESVAWRMQDLLTQAHVLHLGGHTLGSRILIRSALETLAVLIYLNQMTKNVLSGLEGFHQFSLKTSRLLLGSKDKTTEHEAISTLTVLKKADEKYPGLMDLYDNLSESAHPNFEGNCFGYSRVEHDNGQCSSALRFLLTSTTKYGRLRRKSWKNGLWPMMQGWRQDDDPL